MGCFGDVGEFVEDSIHQVDRTAAHVVGGVGDIVGAGKYTREAYRDTRDFISEAYSDIEDVASDVGNFSYRYLLPVAVGALAGGVGALGGLALGSVAGGVIGGAAGGALGGSGTAAIRGGDIGEGAWKGAVGGAAGGIGSIGGQFVGNALGGGVIGGVAGRVVGGAAGGALGSAATGGNALQGAVMGGIGGGLSSVIPLGVRKFIGVEGSPKVTSSVNALANTAARTATQLIGRELYTPKPRVRPRPSYQAARTALPQLRWIPQTRSAKKRG